MELAELLAAEPVSVLAILHVVVGALDAHLHPSLLPAAPRTVAERLRTATITVFCAYVAFLVAALGLLEGVIDLAFAPLLRTDPLLRVPSTLFVLGVGLALLAVVAGGVPIVVAVVHEARAKRPRDLWLLAALPLSLLVLGGCDGFEELLRHNRITVPSALGLTLDLVFHALFVLAALGCTVAICIAVVHSGAHAPLFRFALAPAAVATVAMIWVVGASAVWFVRARVDAPDRLGQPALELGVILLLVLMVVAAALAAVGVVRGLAARATPRTSGNATTS